GHPLPDDKAAARLLAALPARASVCLRVLLDDLAGFGSAARAETELDAFGAQLLFVQGGDLLDRLLGEIGDALHEGLPVAAAPLDVGELVLPVTRQLRGGQLVLFEHRYDLDTFRRRLEVLADTLDVLSADERFDRLRPGRRSSEPRFLHRLAQLLVVHELPCGLHG